MTRYAEDYIRKIVRLHGIPVGKVCIIPWEPDCLVQPFTLKPMGNLNESFRYWKTCYELVLLISPAVGTVSYLWRNLHITTVINPLLEWHRIQHCMAGDVDLLSHWDEVGGKKLLGPELLQQTAELVTKIRERMHTTHSQQKSYDVCNIVNWNFRSVIMFVKISKLKSILRFGKKGKLTPRYIGLFDILERIGKITYQVVLHSNLSNVHNVFHVSMLRKYLANPSHVLCHEPLELASNYLIKMVISNIR